MKNKKLANFLRRCTPGWLGALILERRLSRSTPVLVFQMGKVGSSSVYKSLVEQYPGAVVHLHNLFPTHKRADVRRLHRWAVKESKPVHVISLTREPIGRNISAFFENFERDTGCPFAKSRFSLEELRGFFLANYKHDVPLNWFDEQIRDNFGIDVFATPFPANGTNVYCRGNVRLLVMRAEIPDEEKQKAVGEFLGLPLFRLRNTNIGQEKDYAKTYKAFKNTVALPPEYIARMCDSRYFNHFYARDYVQEVRAAWSRNASSRT